RRGAGGRARGRGHRQRARPRLGRLAARNILERVLERAAHVGGVAGAPATAVTGQDPFEAEVAQLFERAQLLAPVVPANAAAHVEALVVFVPPQVIAGEQEFLAIEERDRTTRVAGDRDDGELVVEGDRRAAVETALNGEAPRVGGVHDALAAEARMPPRV